MARVELGLIPDPEMYILFKKGKRVGVSYISKRYSKANNSRFKSFITQNKNQKISIHLDANSLYGYAMSKFLPTSGLKWIDPKEFDLNKYTSNSSKGRALEVDLQCPKEFRELHNDYLLAPDNIEIKREMLSD